MELVRRVLNTVVVKMIGAAVGIILSAFVGSYWGNSLRLTQMEKDIQQLREWQAEMKLWKLATDTNHISTKMKEVEISTKLDLIMSGLGIHIPSAASPKIVQPQQ